MEKVVARQRLRRRAVIGQILGDGDQSDEVFVEHRMFTVQCSPSR